MFCYKCGARMPDDSYFCPKCGLKLDREALDPDYGEREENKVEELPKAVGEPRKAAPAPVAVKTVKKREPSSDFSNSEEPLDPEDEDFEEQEFWKNELDISPLNLAELSKSTEPAAVKTEKKRRRSEPVTDTLSALANVMMKIGSIPLVLVAAYALLSAIFKLPFPPILVVIAFAIAIVGFIMKVFSSILDKSKVFAYIFLIVAAAALAAGVIFVISLLSGNVYVRSLKKYTPFTNMDYNCGEVFGKYIKSSKWETFANDDGSHIVEISGKVKGTDKTISMHFNLVADGKNFNVELDDIYYSGTKFTSYDAKLFLYSMFTVYGEGYDSLEEGSQLSELTANSVPMIDVTQGEGSGDNSTLLKLGSVGKTYVADNGYGSSLYLGNVGGFTFSINIPQGILEVDGLYYEIPGGYRCEPFAEEDFEAFELQIDGAGLVYLGKSVGGTQTGEVFYETSETGGFGENNLVLGSAIKVYVKDYIAIFSLFCNGECCFFVEMPQGETIVNGKCYEMPNGYKCVPDDDSVLKTFELKFDGNGVIYLGESIGGVQTGDYFYQYPLGIEELLANGNPMTEHLYEEFDADEVEFFGMYLNQPQAKIETLFGEPFWAGYDLMGRYSFSFVVFDDYSLAFIANDEYSPAHTVILEDNAMP